jgi:hypothetical protein
MVTWGAELTTTFSAGSRRLELARRGHERIQMARDLLRAAAGKKREQPVTRADPERSARLLAVRQRECAIEQRMADERRIDAVLAQESLLERQDDGGLRDSARELHHPARS